MKIYTIGHSNRKLEEFLELLSEYKIKQLIDVRTIPRSKYNPQFNMEFLARELEKAGVWYEHMEGLGGLRKPFEDSPNGGWENESFRGYADYMGGDKFREAIGGLLKIAKTERTAIMCAEAVPWNCHRNLISDALVVEKIDVEHIISGKESKLHKLNPMAVLQSGKIKYPPAQSSLF